MSSLKVGKSYTIVEDFSNKKCDGRVINLTLDQDGMPAAIFDVSEDITRDVQLWGNIIAVMTRYPDMLIDNFTGPVVLVNLKKLNSIPPSGQTFNSFNYEVIGTGRGRVEGDFL